MNILVTGANGQLGRCIRDVAEEACSSNTYIFTDVAELDITDREAVMAAVDAMEVDVLVNCAAYTNVDRAETDVDFCRTLNADAPRYLAEAMTRRDGTLIHVSTDYVFGGASGNTPRSETEAPNPTGIYGLTKWEGEQMILATGVKALIFRTAWLYSEYGRNFVKTMLTLIAQKPELKVVFDQVGSPTYARDLAQAIVTIIESGSYAGNEGVYHYSNEGVCSWFDFTKVIAEMAGNAACDIRPCHSSEFPSPVVRPPFSVLDKTKFKATFRLAVPYWMDSLRKCVNNLISADEA